MRCRDSDSHIQLRVADSIASYDELLLAVQNYIDRVLADTNTGGNVVFCDELPETGSEGVLYVVTGERMLYLWDETSQAFMQIFRYETASEEETEQMLDEVFGTHGEEVDGMDETTEKLVTMENLQQAMERVKSEIDSIDTSALSGYEVATPEETEAMLDEVFGTAEDD